MIDGFCGIKVGGGVGEVRLGGWGGGVGAATLVYNHRPRNVFSTPFVVRWPFWTANVWAAWGKFNHHHFHPNGISPVKKEQCKSWHWACWLITFLASQCTGGRRLEEKTWPNIFKSLLPGKGGQVAAGAGVEAKINIYYSYRVCLDSPPVGSLSHQTRQERSRLMEIICYWI